MSSPEFEGRLDTLTTSQRSCAYYVSWFARLYRNGECGWFLYQTVDGRAIIEQDAFFTQALEVIARELNAKIMLERAKVTGN